nr:dsbD [Erythrotrichia foliiformis]
MYNFLDNYIFLFKEYCNYILTVHTVTININTFAAIFLFGWLTSLNPCSLSIIPIYISHISNEKETPKVNTSILFILGLFTNFIIIGSLFIYFAQIYKQFVINFNATSGFLLIFIGVNLLQIFPISSLFINKTQAADVKSNGYLNSFTLGFSSGIITSACNIPILVALLTWLSSLNNYIQSISLSITYTLGYCLSIFSASFLTKFLNQLQVFNRITSWTTSVVGAFMLSSGIFSLCHFFQV